MADLTLFAESWLTADLPNHSGLIARWNLDESSGEIATDDVGSHDGLLHNDPQWMPLEGYKLGSLFFDGIDDYIEITDYQGITGPASRTCSAWIQTTQAPGIIISWGNTDTGGKWIVRVNEDGTLRAEVQGGYIYGTTQINDDLWHHIAVTVDNDGSPNINEARLYVDGKLETIQDSAGQEINTSSADPVRIGMFSASSYYFNGKLDDIQLFDEAIMTDDVFRLYETGSALHHNPDLTADNKVNIEDYAVVSQQWQTNAPQVIINEFMASNGAENPPLTDLGQIRDGNGDSSDWIEIYNQTDIPIDLADWALTDNQYDLLKWRFPENTILDGHGFLIIFASDKDQSSHPENYPYVDSLGYLHTNFNLSANGEYLALVRPDGTPEYTFESVIDDETGEYGYPEQEENVSYGMLYDTEYYFALPTPGKENREHFFGFVDTPDFSHERGYYDTSFSITLTSETEGAVIRYTTDGTEPTLSNGITYINPISVTVPLWGTISKRIIRAAAFKPGYEDSNIRTKTYILNASDAMKSLPGLFLVGSETQTFYNPYGVTAIVGGEYVGGVWNPLTSSDYNNFLGHGIDYERPVSMEYIDPGLDLSFQEDCGIRSHGSIYMRPRYTLPSVDGIWSGTGKPSLRLYFRGSYGEKKLHHSILEQFPEIDDMDTVVLRAGHNDQTNPFVRDEMIRRLQYYMGHEASLGNFVNLYVNGIYKGFYNLCERVDEDFCQKYYDSDLEWDVVGWTHPDNVLDINDGDGVAFTEFINYAETNDLTDPVHYSEVVRQLDLDSFIDYLILECWSGNWDWPQNNWTATAERSPDRIWRFYVWDAEGAMDNDLYRDRFGALNSEVTYLAVLYRALRLNEDFRVAFSDRVQKFFYEPDSVMQPEFLDSLFWQLAQEVEGVIPNINTYIPDTYIPGRNPIFINQCKAQGLFTFQGPQIFLNEQAGDFAESIYENDFESGLEGFVIDNNFGNGNGLWHLSSACPPNAMTGHSTSTTLAYVNDATCTFNNSSMANQGVATSPVINLPASTSVPIILTLNYFLETENSGCSWDKASVEVSSNGGPFIAIAHNCSSSAPVTLIDSNNSEAWYELTADLTSFAGSQIQLRFGFNTVDGAVNDYDGFYIDDIKIMGDVSGGKVDKQAEGLDNSLLSFKNASGVYGDIWFTLDGTDPRLTLTDQSSISTVILVPEDAPKKVLVPTDYIDTDWRSNVEFDDSGWNAGLPANPSKTGGVGYERDSGNEAYISYDVESEMYNEQTSAYVRIPFSVNPAEMATWNLLTLSVRYDDGFVAYLNGIEVCRRNCSGTPYWYSEASAEHENYDFFEDIPINSYLSALQPGENILAIHGLNVSSGSSDFLISAKLEAGYIDSSGLGVSPSAQLYTSPVALQKSARVKVRTLNGSTWSALRQADILIGHVTENLRITELMYHPNGDPNEEFVELKNIGSDPINLDYTSFTDGIDYTFGDTTLGAGEILLLVRNQSIFEDRYGTGLPIAGEYEGALNDGGEKIKFRNVLNHRIQTFDYKDGWYDITDGEGFSLTPIDPLAEQTAIPVHDLVSAWNFNELSGTTVLDSSGLYNGTIYNMQNTDRVLGRENRALFFDGINDYVEITGYQGITGTASRTCSAWIKTTQAPEIIMGWGNTDTGGKWIVRVNDNGTLRAEVQGGYIYGTTPINDGLWHHIAVTLEDDGSPNISEAKLYVDGKLETIQNSLAQAINTAESDPVRIGMFSTSPYHFAGKIDDVRIYAQVLTEDEIEILTGDIWDHKEYWRPSGAVGGSPGCDDIATLPAPGAVVINEVLAHSHAMDPDWIELHNTTDNLINIGGWFLSDNNDNEPNITKYEIPLGTTIEGQGYVVFYEDDFNNPTAPGVNVPFALSEGGDSVYLHGGNDGIITGYEESESFGASASNVAFGRYIKSTLDGGVNFVPMSENTPNTLNAYPKVGPVIITEIMYNPDDTNTGNEYLELKNITSSAVTLEDLVSTEISPGVFTEQLVQWQFSDGIDFVFPSNTTIPAGGYLIIAKDPAAFTTYYGSMPQGVDVLGPFQNGTSLSNGGEQLQIVRPGDQEYNKDRFWIRTERVTYDDEVPWPTSPDGTGDTLHQKTPDTPGANYGNDVINWQSGPPSPGQ